MKRRDFLKATPIAAAGIMAGCQTPSKGTLAQKIADAVIVNGWQLIFPNMKEQLKGGYIADVVLMSSYGVETEFSVSDGLYVGDAELNFEDYTCKLRCYPDEKNLVRISVTRYKDEKQTHALLVPVIPSAVKEELAHYRHLFSEVPLQAQDVGTIKELSDICARFGSSSDIYVFNNEHGRGGFANYFEGRIGLAAIAFEQPAYQQEGELNLFHEQAHGMFNRVLHNERDHRSLVSLWQAYERLASASGYTIPLPTFSLFGPTEQVEKESCFAHFDESNYVNISARDRGYGHPYNDYNELFASGLTVLRYFAEEFMQRLSLETSVRKGAIHNAGKQIMDFARAINTDEDALHRLLPNYDDLAKALLR